MERMRKSANSRSYAASKFDSILARTASSSGITTLQDATMKRKCRPSPGDQCDATSHHHIVRPNNLKPTSCNVASLGTCMRGDTPREIHLPRIAIVTCLPRCVGTSKGQRGPPNHIIET